MTSLTLVNDSSGSDTEPTLDQPIMSRPISSPVVIKHSSSASKNVSSELNMNMNRNFPLDLVLITSNKNRIRLQMTEIIEQTVSVNVIDEDQETDTFGANQLKDEIKSESKNYSIGDLVILQRSKQGLIRYIGELNNDNHIWYGIEMIGGNKGYHDGSFQGIKYFTVMSTGLSLQHTT